MGIDIDLFHGSVDPELICPICMDVFDDPFQDENEHIFCKTCIYRWLENNTKCPLDRKNLSRESLKRPPRIVLNLISHLKLNCKSCDNVIALDQYEEHKRVCEMVNMKTIKADSSKFFLNKYSFSLPNDGWLSQCVEFVSKKPAIATKSEFINEIYKELLDFDLNEIGSSCLPEELFIKENGTLNANYLLQIDLCFDSNNSLYHQIEELNENLDHSIINLEDDSFLNWERTQEIDRKIRVLSFSLSDGTNSIKAIENNTIPFIKKLLLSGTKILLKGMTTYTNQTIHLNNNNVEILGGKVPEIGTKKYLLDALQKLTKNTQESKTLDDTYTLSSLISQTESNDESKDSDDDDLLKNFDFNNLKTEKNPTSKNNMITILDDDEDEDSDALLANINVNSHSSLNNPGTSKATPSSLINRQESLINRTNVITILDDDEETDQILANININPNMSDNNIVTTSNIANKLDSQTNETNSIPILEDDDDDDDEESDKLLANIDYTQNLTNNPSLSESIKANEILDDDEESDRELAKINFTQNLINNSNCNKATTSTVTNEVNSTTLITSIAKISGDDDEDDELLANYDFSLKRKTDSNEPSSKLNMSSKKIKIVDLKVDDDDELLENFDFSKMLA